MLKQKFNLQKAIEVLLYITNRVNNTYNALKVLYFADKSHLSKYGRLICGDVYIAMEHGPVPSNVYDIVKQARGDSFYEFDTEENIESLFEISNRYIIKSRRKANYEYLSETDIECLDEAIKNYGHLNFNDLRAQSHDDAFRAADFNDVIPFEAMIRALPNAEELLEYFEIDED